MIAFDETQVKLQPYAEDANFCVIREAIVGAFGLPPGSLQTSIKGDPSLRETVPIRARYESRMDKEAGRVLDACDRLLTETGVYSIYMGFNSSEVRTESVFNPFNYEIHDAEAIMDEAYQIRHFVPVPYDEKMAIVGEVKEAVQNGPLRKYLPAHWQKLMDRQRAEWRPLPQHFIGEIVKGLDTLRSIEGYYLRNAAISLPQAIVRASFNCDGTYVVAAEYFPEFVRLNTP